MYRRFRRLRVTAIVYACGSLCGILLFINFNEEFKRLIHQKPTYVPGTHDPEHSAEGTINLSRDAAGAPLAVGISQSQSQTGSGDNEETSKIYLDKNSAQSKARQKLNSIASGSLTPSPKDSSSKPWFMWHGSRFPTVATSPAQLWWEENPESDRIVEQLMYLTAQDTQGAAAAPPPYFPAGLRLGLSGGGAGGGEENTNKGIPEPSGMIPGRNTANISSLSPSTPFPPAQVMTAPALKTILLYYGLGMSWGSHIISGRHVFMQQKCPVNACRLTGNRSQMNEADLVVFKDVFMSPKLRRSPDQLWVIYMLECPLNTQNFIDKNVFNLTATYRHDSDIVTPYEKWVYYDDKVRGLPQGNSTQQNN